MESPQARVLEQADDGPRGRVLHRLHVFGCIGLAHPFPLFLGLLCATLHTRRQSRRAPAWDRHPQGSHRMREGRSNSFVHSGSRQ